MPMPRKDVLTMPNDDELRSFALARGISEDQARSAIKAQFEKRRVAFEKLDVAEPLDNCRS